MKAILPLLVLALSALTESAVIQEKSDVVFQESGLQQPITPEEPQSLEELEESIEDETSEVDLPAASKFPGLGNLVVAEPSTEGRRRRRKNRRRNGFKQWFFLNQALPFMRSGEEQELKEHADNQTEESALIQEKPNDLVFHQSDLQHPTTPPQPFDIKDVVAEEDDGSQLVRVTCDILASLSFKFGPVNLSVKEAACATHCLLQGGGNRGGYCNGKSVCVCRK